MGAVGFGLDTAEESSWAMAPVVQLIKPAKITAKKGRFILPS
jgi:hypothetical protein